MASAMADLVASASLDSAQWAQGCIDIQNATAQTEQQTTQSLNKMQGQASVAGAGWGRAIGQMGFAAQDFASVLEGGGKNALSRALMSTMNNVQMLGMAFGPWGMAITSVGGALGAVLIPKLMETALGFTKITEEAERSVKAVKDFGKREADLHIFKAGLNDLQGPEQKDKLSDKIQTEMEAADISLAAKQKVLARMDEQIAETKALATTKFTGAGMGTGAGMALQELLGGGNVRETIGEEVRAAELRAQLKGQVAEREKLLDLITKESMGYTELIAKQDAINALGEVADQKGLARSAREEERRQKAQLKENQRLQKKFEDVSQKEDEAEEKRLAKEEEKNKKSAQDVINRSRTGLEVAQAKLQEIETLATGGFLTEAQGGKAADDILGDFRKANKSHAVNQKVEAVSAGSSEAFSAIQAAIRQDRPAEDKQLSKLQEAVDALKAILVAIGKQPKPQMQGLPP